MTRQRIEDLGRIAEQLHAIMESDIFLNKRNKWNPEPWDAETADGYMMLLEHLHGELCDIWHLARYGDESDSISNDK